MFLCYSGTELCYLGEGVMQGKWHCSFDLLQCVHSWILCLLQWHAGTSSVTLGLPQGHSIHGRWSKLVFLGEGRLQKTPILPFWRCHSPMVFFDAHSSNMEHGCCLSTLQQQGVKLNDSLRSWESVCFQGGHSFPSMLFWPLWSVIFLVVPQKVLLGVAFTWLSIQQNSLCRVSGTTWVLRLSIWCFGRNARLQLPEQQLLRDHHGA